MTRLLHTADWQVGKPFLRVTDAGKRHRLQQERLEVVGRIAEVARGDGVDLLVVAGDLFDSTTVPSAVVMEVLEAIGTIPCPVFVMPGNHDHGGRGSLWHRPDFQDQLRRRAPRCRILLEARPLECEGVVLLPCPLLRPRDSRDPCAWLHSLDWSALPPASPRVVLAHGGVQGFTGQDYDDEEGPDRAVNRIDLARLPSGEIDYVALGDWHNGRQVDARAWYAGTPEPDRFDQGEDERRGQVLVVDIRRGVAPRVTPRATGRLRWHRLQARLRGEADLVRLRARLESLLEGRVCRDLLRLEVSGRLGLAAHARYEALLAELDSQLLALRLRGACERAPEDGELAELIGRSGDPLITRVAAELQRQLDDAGEEPDGEAEEAAAVARLALCELHRLTRELDMIPGAGT